MNENFLSTAKRFDKVQKAVFQPQQPLAAGRPIIFQGTEGMVGTEYLGVSAGDMVEE